MKSIASPRPAGALNSGCLHGNFVQIVTCDNDLSGFCPKLAQLAGGALPPPAISIQSHSSQTTVSAIGLCCGNKKKIHAEKIYGSCIFGCTVHFIGLCRTQ
jgi:hypothetical protein